MDFTNIVFWIALLPALIVLAIGDAVLSRHPEVKRCFHRWLMLVLSISLLCMVSPETVLVFAGVSQLCYIGCRIGVRLGKSGRRLWLCCLIPLLLLPLLYYKYGYFLGSNLMPDRDWNTFRDLVIPVGISFYTFQLIGFCVDTLCRNERMPGWLDYMNFSAYFPQIVCGPIERRAELLPQVRAMELRFEDGNLNTGVRYMILGLFFKMVLADSLAYAFWQNYNWGSAWQIWMNNVMFAFRIYFDFAGYGLTAYGIARCMGITLRMNFLSPYTAGNIRDFWRRWHTSLTGWFTDYIYFPLGGSRTRRWALNIILVFAVSGLWHGANWNFIIWGTLAGVAMVVHRIWMKQGFRMWAPMGWALMFSYMVFVWMFFYITSSDMLWNNLLCLFNPDSYNWEGFLWGSLWEYRAYQSSVSFFFLILSFVVLAVEFLSLRLKQDPYRLFVSDVGCFVMVFMIYMTNYGVHNEFIYFAF